MTIFLHVLSFVEEWRFSTQGLRGVQNSCDILCVSPATSVQQLGQGILSCLLSYRAWEAVKRVFESVEEERSSAMYVKWCGTVTMVSCCPRGYGCWGRGVGGGVLINSFQLHYIAYL